MSNVRGGGGGSVSPFPINDAPESSICTIFHAFIFLKKTVFFAFRIACNCKEERIQESWGRGLGIIRAWGLPPLQKGESGDPPLDNFEKVYLLKLNFKLF